MNKKLTLNDILGIIPELQVIEIHWVDLTLKGNMESVLGFCNEEVLTLEVFNIESIDIEDVIRIDVRLGE